MKGFLVIFAAILLGVSTSPILQDETPRFIQFPDSNGVMHWIDLENEDLPPHRFNPDEDIKYFIYNKDNIENPVEFIKGNNDSIFATKFDPSKPVKISIHGWTGDAYSPSNVIMADAFLSKMDVTVIVIDWGVAAKTDYIRSVRYVPLVGAKVGELIDWLNILGVPFSNVHILGHSLGGHVAGVSGRTTTRGTVEYITGLDPAFPLWGNTSQRIRSSDGKYVEIIHTNGGYLGLMEPVGHTDFYPNGGRIMSGCADISALDFFCSHEMSVLYIADSIDHEGFMANKCNDLEEITSNNCANIGKLHMGGSKIKTGYEGVYYLKTNGKKPYYQG